LLKGTASEAAEKLVVLKGRGFIGCGKEIDHNKKRQPT
jgi:hypothetical protein